MTDFLPHYVNALFKENKKDLYKFEALAAKLFLIFRVFPEDDNSIFSHQIKNFQNCFLIFIIFLKKQELNLKYLFFLYGFQICLI